MRVHCWWERKLVQLLPKVGSGCLLLKNLYRGKIGTCFVVHWLRLAMQGAGVGSLVRKLDPTKSLHAVIKDPTYNH